MNIVVLGGGTGSHGVLMGLKQNRTLDITAIVNMTDDGGSNQVIRDEFGLLPLSDLRKSILALSNDNKNEILRGLFNYRFDKVEGISGHTLGNLIMTALTDVTGSETEAIKAACDIFAVQGNIIPVTLDKVTLVAEFSNGATITGEHNIDEPDEQFQNSAIKRLYSTPIAHATTDAIEAIQIADFIIIGPGDLFTTTIANLIVDGIPQALDETSAKIIYISNLMTKKGQTRGLKMSDHINEIEKYASRRPDVTFVNTGKLPEPGLKRYIEKGENIVVDDIPPHDHSIIRADLVANEEVHQNSGDTLVRSYVRHDIQKLRHTLELIFKNQ